MIDTIRDDYYLISKYGDGLLPPIGGRRDRILTNFIFSKLDTVN